MNRALKRKVCGTGVQGAGGGRLSRERKVGLAHGKPEGGFRLAVYLKPQKKSPQIRNDRNW